MTRLPREPLHADERALAERLPRLHGRDEPDSAMDARILAAAHAALAPMPVAKRRRSWIVPLTAAASVSLAVGLAWQLQPAPGAVTSQAPVATASDASAAAEAPMPQEQATPPPADAIQSMTMPSPARQAMSRAEDKEPINREPAPAESVAETGAAAPMFEPPPPAAPIADAMPAAVMVPPPAPPPSAPQAAMARSASSEAGTSNSGAMPAAAKRLRNEAEVAADAVTSEQFAKAIDEEDVPPATMDAPAARDAWLRRIGALQQEGRIDEAKASLAEFRRRYPDAVLPPELRKLEP